MLNHTNSYFLWIIDFLLAKNTILNLVENAARGKNLAKSLKVDTYIAYRYVYIYSIYLF
jgi:hypothetical protein